MTNNVLNSSWINFAPNRHAGFSSPRKDQEEQERAQAMHISINLTNTIVGWDVTNWSQQILVKTSYQGVQRTSSLPSDMSMQSEIQLQITAPALRCPPLAFFWCSTFPLVAASVGVTQSLLKICLGAWIRPQSSARSRCLCCEASDITTLIWTAGLTCFN